MIWYNIYDIFVNHKSNWIPDLNNCEEMQPDKPHMIDNQKTMDKYIDKVNNDNTLSDFEKYCATRLMSFEMSVWCKKKHIWQYDKKNYHKTTNYDNTQFIWDICKNADGSNKNYLEQLNFNYKYTEYSSINNTLSLDDTVFLYNEDFVGYKSGSQTFMCVSLYRFINILKTQFGIYIRKSPMSDDKIIAYFFDNGKATLLRTSTNTVEFTNDDYDVLIDKIFKSCKLIQKSL